MADIPGSKRAAGEEHTASGTPGGGGGGGSSSSPNKRPRTNEEALSPEAENEDQTPSGALPAWRGPRTIVTFNVNGGIPRMTKDWHEIDAFVTKEEPDLILFQEVQHYGGSLL